MDKRLIKYPLILGLVALVAGLLLALVYNVTAPVIEKNKNKRENAIVLEMYGDDAKIEDISDTLKEEETSKGIYAVLKVTSDGNDYYVYKINVKDAFDGDESSFAVGISDGKISKLKFVSTGDSYAGMYSTGDFSSAITGKSEVSDSDVVTGATKTGEPIIESIQASLGHYGRNK